MDMYFLHNHLGIPSYIAKGRVVLCTILLKFEPLTFSVSSCLELFNTLISFVIVNSTVNIYYTDTLL